MNLLTIPAFGGAEIFHVVVESPRGSTVKLKYESRWEAMTISRPLPLGVTYPFDWGFIPSTAGPDGDSLDALVVWDVGSFPGVVLPCRALGVMHVEQNRRNHDPSERIRNDRILAVPEAAPREQDVTSIAALPQRVRAELEHLAIIAAGLEGKDVRITGWGDTAAALKLISDHAIDR